MSDELIFTGKSVDEAIAEGLRSLGLSQNEADIEVISRGSRGIFGLGSEPAQVRIKRREPDKPTAPQPAPTPEPLPATQSVADAALAVDESPVSPEPKDAQIAELLHSAQENDSTSYPVQREVRPVEDEDAEEGEETSAEEDEQLAALATELLGTMVQMMGFEATVVAEWREPDTDNEQRYLLLDLEGKDLSPLIGRRGDTLGNMQYLVRLMVNQRLHRWKNIVVDVEGYRQRRIDHLSQLALRSAQQVAQTGRPLSLEPMAPGERRIIHITLRDHPDVMTESSGDGERRKVQILPRR
jgi:spoIIIJ-associated protein